MLKVFGFVRRHQSLTHDEYRAAHVGYHNSYGRRLNNIRGYLLNVRANAPLAERLGPLAAKITRNEPAGFDDLWDGWGQLLFDSMEDYLAAKAPARDRAGPRGLEEDPKVASVGGDLEYLYSGSPHQFQVVEHVALPVRRPERKLFKLIQFARCPEALPEALFRAYWTGRYAALVRGMPGLRGLIFNFRTSVDVMTRFFAAEADGFTTEGSSRRQGFYDTWDGIAEYWFDTPGDFIRGRTEQRLRGKLDALEAELFDSVYYREVDETVAVLPNRAPAPEYYHR